MTRKAWNVKSSDKEAPPSFNELNLFLASRIRAFEEFAGGPSEKPPSKPASGSKVHVATASTIPQSACLICHAQHSLHVCPKFVRGNPNQRRDFVKQHRRCFNCLNRHHAVTECQSKYLCRICHQRHHSMFHGGSDSNAARAVPVSVGRVVEAVEHTAEPPVQSLIASANPKHLPRVLLATALVTVSVPSGRSIVVRALIDQESQLTFISEGLAQLLRVKRVRMSVSVSAIASVHAGTARHATKISVSPRDAYTPSYSATAVILNTFLHSKTGCGCRESFTSRGFSVG